MINLKFARKACLAILLGFPLLAAAGAHSSETMVRDLDVYYEKEGVSLADYDAILIDTLGLDDARIVAPPWIDDEDSGPKKWALTNSDAKWLRKSYREAMQAEISGNDGFAIVDEPAKGVLMLDIEIIYLMPYARKGDKVTTRGFGEMLVQAQFRDAMTGELLGVYEGKQDVGSEYQQNTRLNNENNLRGLFQYWGARVRQMMDEAHER